MKYTLAFSNFQYHIFPLSFLSVVCLPPSSLLSCFGICDGREGERGRERGGERERGRGRERDRGRERGEKERERERKVQLLTLYIVLSVFGFPT